MVDINLETRSVADGATIFKEGDAGTEAYLILDGFVTVSHLQDGDSIALGTRADGEIIGEMALIDESPRSATVTAEGDVKLQVITKDELEDMLCGADETLTIILSQLLESLRCANDLISMYAARPSE